MPDTHLHRELHPLLGGGVSLAFWMCLGLCGGLFAAVAWAPQLLERERLQSQRDSQQRLQEEVSSEIRHLKLLRISLEQDPEFAARMAAADLNFAVDLETRIPVADALDFDPRERRASTIAAWTLEPPWYVPMLRELATPTTLRSRWLLCTALLCLISFTSMHDGIFSSPLGRLFTEFGSQVKARYRQQVMGCEPHSAHVCNPHRDGCDVE